MAERWSEATVPGMFFNRVERFGDRAMLVGKENGRWASSSWNQVAQAVRETSLGLMALGLAPNGTVTVLSQNRKEWTCCDLAIMSARGVTVPIYASNIPKDCAYIVGHSESRFCIVENGHQLAKVLETWDGLPALEKVLLIEGEKPGRPGVMTLSEVREEGRRQDPAVFEERVRAIDPEDLYTISYTSGTTGPPKGVMLTHRSMRYINRAILNYVQFSTDDVTLCFLPLAHMMERFIHYSSMHAGVTIHFAESIEKVPENLLEVRPHAFFSVPRLFEKVYAAILSNVEAGPPRKKRIFGWARRVGERCADLEIAGKPVPPLLVLQRRAADRLVFKKIRARLGGRVRYIGSGGAPISPEIVKFFHAIGLPPLEAYGLTETSAPATVNARPTLKFGTVGKPMPGCEVKIAPDGEVLIRGDNLFSGYFKRPEDTGKAMDGGWFCSGDIGELDADGFLRITDRKKDLIITAAGKNIAPQNIENLVKTDRYLSQVVVIGDRRAYLTALLTLNLPEVRRWAQENGVAAACDEALAADPKVLALVQKSIDAKNRELTRFEQIKKFRILPADFSQETGELTPTMKVKRNVVNKKYAGVIEAMYT
ncbi:MAG: long-chain fatty acid--CoA ligase [Deltaproteobacteria bacterium]|nr:long-chain fatty acid--CoA ligase [Deltaproteobacteria bacterium]